jgi:Sap, sulfolipid-1-addressing protein
MGNLLVLALAAAVYPTLLALVLVVLTRPHPARLLAAYLAGGFIIGIGSGCIVVFALKGAGIGDMSANSVSPAVDISAGAVSIALALLLATGRDPRPERLKARRAAKKKAAPQHDSWTKRAVSHDSLKLAFALGLVLDLPSVWYLVALKDIARDQDSATAQVLSIVAFNVIMFALAEVPLIAYLIDPDHAQATVNRFNAWLHSHARKLTEALAGGVGAYLVVKGVVAL